jgi:hypothetical protein
MMSANKEGMYWFDFIDEWIDYDNETKMLSVKPDAPEKVKTSFDIWKVKNPRLSGLSAS